MMSHDQKVGRVGLLMVLTMLSRGDSPETIERVCMSLLSSSGPEDMAAIALPALPNASESTAWELMRECWQRIDFAGPMPMAS